MSPAKRLLLASFLSGPMRDSVEEWLLSDGGLAWETVRVTMRTAKRMERQGLSWAVFMQGPLEAKREMRRLIAGYKRDGKTGHAIRDALKAANRVAKFCAASDLTWEGYSWPLPPEPKAEPKTLEADQVEATHRYQHPNVIIQKRRRAILYLLEGSGIRRGEVARLRLRDLDEEHRRVWVEHPTKRGVQRWVLLPNDAFHPKRPLSAWLRARPFVEALDSLWVVKPAGASWRAMTVDGFSREMDAISDALGFRVSATRYRRFDTDRMDMAGVNHRVIQRRRGHGSLLSTERYLSRVTSAREVGELRKVTGFRR